MKRVFLTFYFFLIFSLLFVQFAIGPAINKGADIYLKDAVIEYNRQLAKGSFHMIELDLIRLPPDEWPKRIQELEPQFGYAIGLFDSAGLELTPEQLEQLRQDQIAVVDGGELLFHRVGGSEMVLRKGPFSVLEPDTSLLSVIIYIAVTVTTGLLTLIWIIPYWRSLRKISSAATAFGNGNFNVRTAISKRSSIFPIASAFNIMADRIQQLINSHKELTNAVSHELRTPLSRVRFGLEMLETSEDAPSRSHYARELQTDVTELEELVSELLTFARFDREKPELQFGRHRLEPFLHQLLAKSIPGECPIRYQLHCHLDEQSAEVRFEPKYLARALGNLIQNALRYADYQLQVTVERNGIECIMHFDDDGPGIPEVERQRVFEPFTRLDASRSRMSGGYGLGLAIVRRIFTWHNGRAMVGDSSLKGARLTVSWPGFRQ